MFESINLDGGALPIGAIGLLALILLPIFRPEWVRPQIRRYRNAAVLTLAGLLTQLAGVALLLIIVINALGDS
ncbi:MAG: hypothetical protein ACOC0O_04415 [Spirochaetota bacterium]